MGGGRKNLKRAVEEESLNLEQCHSIIMRVVDLRGSKLIEGALLWLMRAGERKQLKLGLGRKVGCIVTQVLFHEQVRALQKSQEWPEIFRSTNLGATKEDSTHAIQTEENEDSSDDDGPPLEANPNRIRPFQLHSDTEPDSDSDS